MNEPKENSNLMIEPKEKSYLIIEPKEKSNLMNEPFVADSLKVRIIRNELTLSQWRLV
jgi:hypothetical protein